MRDHIPLVGLGIILPFVSFGFDLMLCINAVGGCKYLIKRDSILYVKGDGNKSYIYINYMKDPIVSSTSFDELVSQIAVQGNVVDSMLHREKVTGKYEEPIQLVHSHRN
ncbi:hypothetical protein [Pantoea cypripedii]|uniref:Uncharacterized protein n=1 Tax=Pantoea cypripedii TaxID=55209 RepID=A0A6B9GFG2_PANCY|nr:hypothetical protein [Pantoea cypripedii]QGY32105.1 hypothetical protein CUN67_24225 [Pantoea cypripedii]